MAHELKILQFILDRHLPYAAIAMDGHWNCVLSNRAASQFFPMLISPALDDPSNNVLRFTFHPEGSRRWIVNWPEVEQPLLSRAELQFRINRRSGWRCFAGRNQELRQRLDDG